VERAELPRYTVEDYKHWEGDWELIEGIPYAGAPSPYGKHQRISLLIAGQIEEQLEECFAYPALDWIVDWHTVVRPDLFVICKRVDEHLKEPPEVVFEVVSKSTAFKDEKVKFSLYEREGVKYYALFYPELRKARVFKLEGGRYQKVFDGEEGEITFETECPFKVNLSRIWKRA